MWVSLTDSSGTDKRPQSLPGASKEATLRPLLEPFPVSGVGKGLTHSAPPYKCTRTRSHMCTTHRENYSHLPSHCCKWFTESLNWTLSSISPRKMAEKIQLYLIACDIWKPQRVQEGWEEAEPQFWDLIVCEELENEDQFSWKTIVK